MNPSYQFSRNEIDSLFFKKFFETPNLFYINNPLTLKEKNQIFLLNDHHPEDKKISSENFKNILKQIKVKRDTTKLRIKSLNNMLRYEPTINNNKVKFETPFITNLPEGAPENRDKDKDNHLLKTSQIGSIVIDTEHTIFKRKNPNFKTKNSINNTSGMVSKVKVTTKPSIKDMKKLFNQAPIKERVA